MGAKTSKTCSSDSFEQGLLVVNGDTQPKNFWQNVKLACKADVLPESVRSFMKAHGIDAGNFYGIEVKNDLTVIIPMAISAGLVFILILMVASRRRHPVVME